MVDAGGFHPDLRVELLDGEIVNKMSPQGRPHVTAILCTEIALRSAFGSGVTIYNQSPFNADDISVPEPDLAVVSGGPRDYLVEHPSEALLLVEVSDSTLRDDLTRKARIYARSGVPEYWVVDLPNQALVVHRVPTGEVYMSIEVYSVDASVSPLNAPDASIPVSDLLP